jgi:hypothetical protein
VDSDCDMADEEYEVGVTKIVDQAIATVINRTNR